GASAERAEPGRRSAPRPAAPAPGSPGMTARAASPGARPGGAEAPPVRRRRPAGGRRGGFAEGSAEAPPGRARRPARRSGRGQRWPSPRGRATLPQPPVRYPSCFDPPMPTHHSNEVSADEGRGLNMTRMGGVNLASFKVKLVAYFLVLALLPLVAAFWGFTAVAGQNETHKVDGRIQAGMRAALTAYDERINEAASVARVVAQTPAVQNELRLGDTQALLHALRDAPNVSITTANGDLIG